MIEFSTRERGGHVVAVFASFEGEDLGARTGGRSSVVVGELHQLSNCVVWQRFGTRPFRAYFNSSLGAALEELKAEILRDPRTFLMVGYREPEEAAATQNILSRDWKPASRLHGRVRGDAPRGGSRLP